MAKRVFDILLSAALLALLALPFALLAVAVRLDSPGPAFYRQRRVGRHGQEFWMHKFRTMVMGADAKGPLVTVGQDARITRLGRWLRHYRIDELPQLWDVLRGRMSLVGPRPEVPRYVAHYPAEMRARVLAVRPGVTDPASLAYIDEAALLARAADPEATYVREILPRKLALQAEYAAHASLWADVQVLMRTVRVLLAH